jgi:hypothetical protein
MKFRHTTLVILGLIAVLSVIGFAALREPFLAADLTLPEVNPVQTNPTVSGTTLQQELKNKVKPPSDQEPDQNTLTDFIISPDASELWPIILQKEPIVVQRHNQISAWKIMLDRQLIDDLEHSEQLNLYIPQTERRVTITLNSTKSGRYSRSKIATIDGTGGAYSAYFTLGSETLYGSIETPEGVFHIEQNNKGEAMIYAASEIRENLDYSISDAVVVSPPIKGVQ